ncbi:MAG: MtnX-like HAD-IB family phosphatase [Candidatus Coatesbacteria bacterium]|nr:MtnX-like HAD-IB family phosphatase [Candidatus Coatesbacteria bacterium]
MKKKIAILVDFDGTIFPKDIGHNLFKKFASSKKNFNDIIDLWKKKRISSRDCTLCECSLVETAKARIDDFINEQKIDPYFKSFYYSTREKNIPVAIFSDGLDYYINMLLKREGLSEIPSYSNKILFLDKVNPSIDYFTATFPYFYYGCGNCGNCKSYHLSLYRTGGHDTIVYIGDGQSDCCPAKFADIVLAKCCSNGLRDYMETIEKTYFPFRNFKDVEEILFGKDSILSKSGLM